MFAGQFGSGETRNIPCSQALFGRFVSVYMEDSGFLTLCEVQVFGRKSFNLSKSHLKTRTCTPVILDLLSILCFEFNQAIELFHFEIAY